jgi:hypothetical protein
MSPLICQNELRREKVRQQQELNGLDYLEVGELETGSQGEKYRTLTIHFLGKAQVSLQPANIVIEGGRRIRDVKAITVRVIQTRLAEFDDYMEVVTDKEGDFSTYTLRVVDGKDGYGAWKSHPAFDPRYDRIEFSFKVDCPSDLDCRQETVCPPEKPDEPEINYLAKDYASFRQLILDRLALVMPDWKERHVPDLGITLVELLAYVGDHLSYYQDAVATEAYLDTARQRISVRRHVRLVDYPMHEGCNARTWVCVETDSDLKLDPGEVYFITGLDDVNRVTTAQALQQQPAGSYEVFEPIAETKIELYASHHDIRFYTWGDLECCLPKGATTATLQGYWIEEPGPEVPRPCGSHVEEAAEEVPSEPVASVSGPELHLKLGDVLIFEEVIGPKTGNRADADPLHRHPVRLTGIQAGYDPLYPEIAITEIRWSEEDALSFPLCLSAMGPPELQCRMITNISVARGNLILVDHGQAVHEPLEPVTIKETVTACDCLGGVTESVSIPELYRQTLKKGPLTYRQPIEPGMPASRLRLQDPRQALSQIKLTGTSQDSLVSEWTVQRDLLGSQRTDLHFVAEMDDVGRAHLRFGNDELGQRPDAGTQFNADYRVGIGPVGNVGAGVIRHLVTRNSLISGGIVTIRNPLPAVGGTLPESLAEVKLFAPQTFRKRLERAITPADYAAIVMREFPARVQRAAATFHWNGSGYEVLVAIDPFGKEEADEALLTEIEQRLYRYQRIGHDVCVKSAQRVPIKLTLSVCVLPGYFQGHVKAALREVFSNRTLPDGRPGFFHPDNLTFGDGIYLSKVIATAQAVTGVESVVVDELQRFFEPPEDEIEKGVLALGPLEIARLDNDLSSPENGLLTFNMGGGR